jgi:hypothetical protein
VTSSGSAAGRLALLAVLAILLLSIYQAVGVSSLQNQLSSLQNQNLFLQNQVGNLQGQQATLQIDLSRLLSTSTKTNALSIELSSVCLSVTPQCYTYPEQKERYVYAMAVTNNGSVTMPVTDSVYLSLKDVTRMTYFGFNSSLPQELTPGETVYLNATTWPQYVNATSKLAAGDEVGLAVYVGNAMAVVETHVIACTLSTTTFTNYALTQTATGVACS